jgi:cold shock CspA family protein
MIGTIKQWNPDRGFGWIRIPNGKHIFFHITNWEEPLEPPSVGCVVELDVGPGVKGQKEQAVNVHLPEQKELTVEVGGAE